VADPRPGWYPYRPPNASTPAHKPDSWSDLARAAWPSGGNLRYWNGSKWEGATAPDSDICAIFSCPNCKRFTGFLPLTPEESRPYLRALTRYEERVGFIAGIFSVFTSSKPDSSSRQGTTIGLTREAALLKCVDCLYHVAVCLTCRMVNPATPGIHKCEGCDMRYIPVVSLIELMRLASCCRFPYSWTLVGRISNQGPLFAREVGGVRASKTVDPHAGWRSFSRRFDSATAR
jgi:hypothetical protein